MIDTVKIDDSQELAPEVFLTPGAIAHVQRYVAQHEQGQHLRISVKTAGCNGLQYVYDIVAQGQPNDYSFPQTGFTLFIAEKSMTFIKGSTFDYIEQGIQRGWQVKNPQETGSCGCGESFNI